MYRALRNERPQRAFMSTRAVERILGIGLPNALDQRREPQLGHVRPELAHDAISAESTDARPVHVALTKLAAAPGVLPSPGNRVSGLPQVTVLRRPAT